MSVLMLNEFKRINELLYPLRLSENHRLVMILEGIEENSFI